MRRDDRGEKSGRSWGGIARRGVRRPGDWGLGRRTGGQCREAEPRLQGQLYSFDPTRQLPFQAAGGHAPGRGSACIKCPATRIGSILCPGFA